MKRRILIGLLALGSLVATQAQAENRFIVRETGGLPVMEAICTLLGCDVAEGLDGTLGQVFLVTTSDATDPKTFLEELLQETGVVDAELDLLAHTADSGYHIPSALRDTKPVDYFGTTVPEGYVNQPANQIVGLSTTQSDFDVKGAGVVAVIDTGIDPSHPALKNVLVPGYDFTRNQSGEADEKQDVTLTHKPYASTPRWTSPNIAAAVDQSTAAVVDKNPGYADFGHGTMVAGVIHVVAPGASLMPLKAFKANGTGYASDIIRAIYWAEQNDANVINMSFNLAAYSEEVAKALDRATLEGIICVAAAGNEGKEILVYPAALKDVMGVASTTNEDQRSTFSNYGPKLVWVAAPGEGIVTTYPFSTYAAGWGTSFSAPYVSGVAALMLDYEGSLLRDIKLFLDQSDAANATAHAKWINAELGHGRLDAYQAVQAWRQTHGAVRERLGQNAPPVRLPPVNIRKVRDEDPCSRFATSRLITIRGMGFAGVQSTKSPWK